MSPAQVENVRDGAVENLRGEAQGIGPAPDALGVDDDVRAAMEKAEIARGGHKTGHSIENDGSGPLVVRAVLN